MTLPHSKSEQLAKAIAAEFQSSPLQPEFRPDSLWSEGGADVVWSGHGGMHAHRDGFVSPPLPSPAGRSTHTQFSSNTDSSVPEFADADEGNGSEEDDSWEANTTMTTMSTMDSRKALNGLPSSYNQNSPVVLKAPPPARPKRKAPIRAEQTNPLPTSDDEEADTNKSSYGHTRITSIGSSIWAGRGRNEEDEAPPLPPLAGIKQHSAFGQAAKGRQSVSSSVYSQSPAMDWDESPRVGSMAERFASPTDGKQTREDGEFEMMNTGKATAGDDSYDINNGKRRLADGTLVPKMPPMPSAHANNQNGTTPPPRTKSKRGRQNRSPVLSYADGAEEEARLVEEREFREHGGIQGLEVTSSMGPRLKKNSPAPWETADGEEFESDALRPSHDGWGMNSRPSFEQLLPPNVKTPSTWARQSMEHFRNRNASNGSQSQQSQAPPLPSAPSKSSSLGLGSKDSLSSPIKSSMDGAPIQASSADNPLANRRSRSKSVSNSAAGMLKGLGLASSASPATKKPSKFGKAFRGMGTNSRSSSSSTGGGIEGKKSQGISSEDYAHLPPSPLVDHRHLSGASPDPFGTNAQRSETEAKLTSSTSGSTLTSSRPMGYSPTPPVAINMTTDRLSSSNDSHAGTSVSGTATSTSQNTGGTSPGLAPAKGDLADLLMASTSKYKDQAFVPSPTKVTAGRGHGLAVGGGGGPSSPTSPVARLSSVSYKRSSTFGSDSLDHQSFSTKVQDLKMNRSESATPTAAPRADSSSSSPHSITSKGLAGESSSTTPVDQQQHANLNTSGLPSVGSLESVPYKLISLQEARLQQQQQQQHDQQLRKSSMSSKEAATRMDRSTSNKSLEQLSENREENHSSKSLKNKKSGFLRMFGKDKGEGSEEGFGSVPAMPNNFDLQRRRVPSDEMGASRGSNNNNLQPLNAPALSLRPMSSMFNGFAPGLLDDSDGTTISAEKTNPNQLSTPHFQNNGRLAPTSPSITIHSIDGQSSRASSHASFEDAIDQTIETTSSQHLQTHPTNPRLDTKSNSSSSNSKSGDVIGGGGGLTPTSPANSNFSQQQPRRSTDSARSDASSALGLVNGFPATPANASPMINVDAPSSEATALALATRSKALAIEAKIAEMVAELVKLRTTAVESGLVSPTLSAPAGSSNGSHGPSDAATVTNTPASPSLLANPISACSQCGCQCAEQKRLQTLNEMAILKGISVLDRGRALKPLSNGNAGKFGSYLHR